MKRLLLPLLFGLASHGHAAISLTPSLTTGVQSFTSLPAAADWSTAAIGSSSSAYATAADVGGGAQTLAATAITAQLGAATVPATNALARYSGSGATGLIYTASTGVNATFLMATLQNDSEAAISAIAITYDYSRVGTTVAEQVEGFRVYYSLTGAANSWTPINALSGISATQAGLTATATLSAPWADGTKLYLLWADDNNTTGTDNAFTIDNFSVAVGNPAPTVALTAPSAGSVATAPASFALTATASDDGSVSQVEFLRNGTVIETDTTFPYAFDDSGLAAGNYSYAARATDNLGATATGIAAPVAVFTDAANTALLFDGVNDCVTMGAAPQLCVGGPPANGLTLECWFRKEGAGITSSSGSGGVIAVPLFGKGRGEAEGSNVDCNYYFGITTAGLLVADFETYPGPGLTAGQNYPITATNTPIVNNVWNHAAVTYDGATATWKMYLNGVQVGTAAAVAGALPRYDSIQHFGIGAAFNSTGVREGAFAGRMDEVRVWNYARSAAEIAATKDTPITAPTAGLLARYGMNEGTGTSTTNSVGIAGAPAGTLTNGPLWTDGAPLITNDAPFITLTAPADNTTVNAPANLTMTATATDGDGSIVKVEFFVDAAKVGEDTVEPYSHDLAGLAAGDYALTAKATDNLSGFTTSSVATLHVMPPLTTPPTVAISSPLNNANFIAATTIDITATAADSDGTVTKVEFFNGATKLGEDSTTPYTFAWTNVAVGDYTLTAKATDDQTATTTSAAVTVHVLINQPPIISLVSPADGVTGIASNGTVALEASGSDPESLPLTVTFYGRAKMTEPGPDFTLVTLPDTQFYSENNNNRFSQFLSQTNWIVSQKEALNIAFVAHMGDMVQNGDSIEAQWTRADSAMDIIEDPATTLLTHGIPWGGAPGNHDIGTGSGTGTTNLWNQYFGTSRWAGRPYFQGNYGTNNDNNCQFFSASGMDFIIINLAYRTSADPAVHNWADALLKAYPNHRAIVTSHWIINTGNPATFGGQGQAIYDNLKDNPNLFLLLCGHVHGEGQRSDTFEGRTVYSVLQDYQDRAGGAGGFGGGDGWLRYFTFSPANNAIYAKTYRTTSGAYETDTDSQFTLNYNMSGGSNPWVPLGTVNLASGETTASLDWTGLAALAEFEWYAAVSDGPNSIGSTVRTFTTTANTPPTVVLTAPADGSSVALPNTVNFSATASDANGSIAKVEFYAGATKVGEDATAPYDFAWTAISGAYVLTAVALDNQGERTTSGAVNITVTNPANMLPTVAITAPANNSTLVANSLNLAATASDADGTISKVEFYNGAAFLGDDTTVPFAFNWISIAPGSYALTARATDNDGGVTTSTVVNVTLNPPGNFTGSLTETFDSMGTSGAAPPGTWTVKNGNSGTTKTTWLTSITASGANSVAAMVDAATPMTAITTPSAANNNGYNAAFSAVDTANRVLATSPTSVSGAALQLELNNGTGAPLTALDISYDIVRYTAVATPNELPGYWLFYSLDSGATWTNVAVLNPAINGANGVVVPNTAGVTNVPQTSLPLNSAWSVNTPLLLRWVDDNADPTSPDQIIGLDNVTLTLPPATPPTVAITSPVSSATFDAAATINLTASAADTNGTVTKVEFFNGATKLGEDTTAPYELTWNSVISGAYSLTAVATDNDLVSTTSTAINVTVTNVDNVSPMVAITSPLDGATVFIGTVVLTAAATDSDGIVSKVEFFQGATKLGEDTSAPFSLDWNNASAGDYTLTTVAMDNDAGATTSAAVNIRVVAPVVSSLIGKGSAWKYLDTGSDQGMAWNAPEFDDSTWAMGAGPLGYGDAHMVTTVNGGPPANRFITTYLRRAFNVADVSKVAALTINLMRDDGAIIYLNGTEIARSNMPGGSVNYLTNASTTISGADETIYIPLMPSSLPLVNGTNMIAVEVHNSDGSSDDLGFDLEVIATSQPAAPSVVTLTAVNVTPTTATLRATVNPNGSVSTALFQHGLDTAYGTDTAVALSPDNGTMDQEISTALTGLLPNTMYHFRVAVGNIEGISEGMDVTFTTAALPVIAFSSATYEVDQESNSVALTVTRAGYGAATSVTVQTDDGTMSTVPPFAAAVAPTDYTDLTGAATTVSFGEGETTRTVTITLISNTAATTPNKRFTATLSSPTGGATLGPVATTTIAILANDTVKPTLVVTTPGANASLSTLSPYLVKGTAGDAKGIDRVEIALNNGDPMFATRGAATSPTSVPWSLPIEPVAGENTIVVTAYDLHGNSTMVTRNFRFTRRYVFTLNRTDPAVGTVALSATPATAASALAPSVAASNPKTSHIVPGTTVKLTASVKAGAVFSRWTGLPEGAIALGGVATFTMPATDLAVTAEFIDTPFAPPPGLTNTFLGLLHPTGLALSTNATEGLLTGTLAPSGSFTGKLLIDGVSQTIAATFHGDGSAVFKSGATKASSLTFGGRALTLAFDAGAIRAVFVNGENTSEGVATRAIYSKTNKMPGVLLNSASATKGFYTVSFPSQVQTGNPDASSYPQGHGFATLSLSNAGTVSLAGTLADGTAITASSAIVVGNKSPVLIQLRTPGAAAIKGGSFSGLLAFDNTEADSDVTAPDCLWFRPAGVGTSVATNLYTAGWPNGIRVNAFGALYGIAIKAQASLGLGNSDATNPNAQLLLTDGKLTSPVTKNSFNISGNAVVKVAPLDRSFTLTLVPTKGSFSGSFTPNWLSPVPAKPAFKGILIQKGSSKGGYGFFISNAKGDADPESGSVTLGAP